MLALPVPLLPTGCWSPTRLTRPVMFAAARRAWAQPAPREPPVSTARRERRVRLAPPGWEPRAPRGRRASPVQRGQLARPEPRDRERRAPRVRPGWLEPPVRRGPRARRAPPAAARRAPPERRERPGKLG